MYVFETINENGTSEGSFVKAILKGIKATNRCMRLTMSPTRRLFDQVQVVLKV